MTDSSGTTGSSGFADDGERFRLDSRIATGGMGEVWRATDTTLDRPVAVKLLKSEFADDPIFRQRFETEARHAAALHHPGIAAVFDFGERTATDGSEHARPFLVMELVEGQPLSSLLLAGRDLDPDAVRDLMSQVGDALGAAHAAGIIHRDVKPANLIVTPGGQVKVTDFGIARAADGVGITRTGAVMGTPQYLSPEQAEGKPASSASDVYSLGVVTYECLARRRPFEADSPVATALAHIRQPVPDLPESVPADLAHVVTRALAKDPADRYADGAAFAAALRDPAAAAAATPPHGGPTVSPTPVPVPAPVPAPDTAATQLLGGASAPVTPVPPVPPATGELEHSRRNPWPIVAIVLLVVALAVVLTLILTSGADEGDPAGSDATADLTESSRPSRSPSETAPSSEPTQADPTTTEPETVTVDASDYEGRPFGDVEADLRDLGLRVVGDERANVDPAQNGEVITVDPQGEQQPNTTITVTYWGEAPVETEQPTETPTSEPPPSTEPPPATAPPTSTAPAPTGAPTGAATGVTTTQENLR